jgi:hypothetical protein
MDTESGFCFKDIGGSKADDRWGLRAKGLGRGGEGG